MLKSIALLVAMAVLTIVKPSNAVAQDWGGWGGGVTVNVGFPFPHRDCCERRERRFFPRRVDCCERRFFPSRVDCCEERRFFPSRVDCCEERRFFPRAVGRPPYYYGDSFAPYGYNWNAGYSE